MTTIRIEADIPLYNNDKGYINKYIIININLHTYIIFINSLLNYILPYSLYYYDIIFSNGLYTIGERNILFNLNLS